MTTTSLWTSEEATLESALTEAGWQQQDELSFRLQTERGDALLEQIALHDEWRHLQLSGSAAPKSKKADVLQNNVNLFGPAKFVARTKRQPICRFDVPENLSGWVTHGGDWNGALHTLDPFRGWAGVVTACVTDPRNLRRFRGSFPPAADNESIAEEIRNCGWAATVDEGEIRIHMQLPGVFRQVRVEQIESTPVKVAADLVELKELSSDSLKAIDRLANEANGRLPLVRFAVKENGSNPVLRAEVHLGCALIPGAWLAASLEVIETAIALTARELEALRDPELAKHVQAAATA